MSIRTSRRLPAAAVLAAICLWPLVGHARDNIAAAAKALKAGDLRTAELELRNAVRADPQNAAARFELAEVELQLADPVSAERDARAAAQRGFDSTKTTPLIGQALLAQNRPDDLLKEFQVKGDDKKLNAEILVLRGEAQARIGKLDDATASFKQAEAVDPTELAPWVADARLALIRGDVATATDQVGHALAIDPKSVDALVLKAGLMKQKGDLAGAKALLDKTITEEPPAVPARLERANILIGQGKVAEAKPDLNQVLKITPNNVQALFLRAVVLHDEKDDKGASALLQRLEPAFASFPRAYLLRAAVQQRLGELQQAEESAAKYIARVPGDVNGYKLLAQLYIQDHRPDQAIVPLKQAVEVGKADAAVYDLLGRSYAATGQPAAAVDALGKASEMSPGNVGLETALAGAIIADGHPDKALGVLEKTLAKNPANAGVQEAAVGAALATGDVAKAESVLAKVKATSGDTPAIQNLTAMLQLARLDAAGAQVTLDKLLKTDPDFASAKINLARALIMQGEGAKAEALLTAILAKDPTAEPALTLMVDEQARVGHVPAALALLQKAHDAAPANAALTARLGTLLIQSGTPQKALDLAEAASPGGAAPNPAMLLLEANAQVALKQPAEARATLVKLVALQPRAVQIRRELAAIEIQAGDYEAARNLIKEGISVTPDVYQLYLDYTLVDLKASGLKAALASADQLRADNQANLSLNALRGDILVADQKPLDAAKAYQEAAAKAPSAELAERTAGAYIRAGKPEEGRAALAAWVAKNPDDLTAVAALSEIDITAGKLDAAKTELQAILAKQPRNAVALNNLAWLYQQQGDPQAKPMAEEAYLLSPSQQSADTLGWILTQSGDPAKGLVLLRQAAAGGDPRVAYHLAVALNDVGQKDDAVKVLHAVVAVKGDFSEKTDAEKLLGKITKGS